MKKRLNQIIILFLSVGLIVPATAFAEQTFFSWMSSFSRMKGVSNIENKAYEEECGACHFPYQPGLLPGKSWEKLLDPTQLEDHFGDNAELDEDVRISFLKFTTNNAAGTSWYKRSRKIMASLNKEEVPLRITEIPYIKDKHEAVLAKAIKQEKKVRSLSYCNKCHRLAAKGIYDDDTVVIPR